MYIIMQFMRLQLTISTNGQPAPDIKPPIGLTHTPLPPGGTCPPSSSVQAVRASRSTDPDKVRTSHCSLTTGAHTASQLTAHTAHHSQRSDRRNVAHD